jgi:hypothetical protein
MAEGDVAGGVEGGLPPFITQPHSAGTMIIMHNVNRLFRIYIYPENLIFSSML